MTDAAAAAPPAAAPLTPEPGASSQSIAAAISDRLRSSAPGDGTATDAPAPQAGDAAPRQEATGDDQGTDRQEETPAPIDPPRSWAKEARDRWAKLDRETQEYLLQRDSEDTAAVRRGQNEAAETRKKAEAEVAQIGAERQRTAQQLQFLENHILAFDPILAEGAKTDWAKLAQDAPGEYVAKRAQYDQRVNTVNAIQAERQRLHDQALTTAKHRMVETLRRDLNLDDKGWQEFDRDLTSYLVKQGYRVEFIAQVVDPLSIHMARKSMLYDKQQAERAAIEAKKKAPAAPARVMRAGAIVDGPGSDARFEAAKKAALKNGSPRAIADVIAERLRATPQP